ncbi:conserved hypothetical protein [Actinosynnema mirum DSM 43827]|uniref:Uncharacterized protein n=1 Tax=Actinosynnema mirum (strain ATCC 29888 / DSM 43827 / JCM 3225 / NBRC 14064 / NCIMB 13271 / NRRL B-12336 / IMRU 3971 / 101) TaxID=446462 RepID=C6WRN4_ACTMD|nr:conserved hypothetical protein [Actinosynnema mirum DSM 43827]
MRARVFRVVAPGLTGCGGRSGAVGWGEGPGHDGPATGERSGPGAVRVAGTAVLRHAGRERRSGPAVRAAGLGTSGRSGTTGRARATGVAGWSGRASGVRRAGGAA